MPPLALPYCPLSQVKTVKATRAALADTNKVVFARSTELGAATALNAEMRSYLDRGMAALARYAEAQDATDKGYTTIKAMLVKTGEVKTMLGGALSVDAVRATC